MTALAKTIYISMIKVKKLFVFAFRPSARVPTGFLILPNFHLRFFNFTGNRENMFSFSYVKKQLIIALKLQNVTGNTGITFYDSCNNLVLSGSVSHENQFPSRSV